MPVSYTKYWLIQEEQPKITVGMMFIPYLSFFFTRLIIQDLSYDDCDVGFERFYKVLLKSPKSSGGLNLLPPEFR